MRSRKGELSTAFGLFLAISCAIIIIFCFVVIHKNATRDQDTIANLRSRVSKQAMAMTTRELPSEIETMECEVYLPNAAIIHVKVRYHKAINLTKRQKMLIRHRFQTLTHDMTFGAWEKLSNNAEDPNET